MGSARVPEVDLWQRANAEDNVCRSADGLASAKAALVGPSMDRALHPYANFVSDVPERGCAEAVSLVTSYERNCRS